jgi:hypothetical protein
MRMTEKWSARIFAGALLLCAAAPLPAERFWLAADRADHACPAPGPPFGAVPLPASGSPATAGGCLVRVPVPDLTDATLDDLAARIARLGDGPAVDLDLNLLCCIAPALSSEERKLRLPYALKKLSSSARASLPGRKVLVSLTAIGEVPGSEVEQVARILLEEDLEPYLDRVALPASLPQSPSFDPALFARPWVRTTAAGPGGAVNAVLAALARVPAANPVVVGEAVPAADWESLRRLQAYLTDDVSRDPTTTKAVRRDGTSFDVLRFFDAKKFTPILLLPEDPAGAASIELSGGPFAKATVENLGSGVKKDFDLRGAKTLTLDLSKGPLAAVLQPAARQTGETRAAVEVGASRGLTAEEIVARERAWDAGQREKVQSFIAEMKASLRFRIGEVNETFDLTILGPFYFRRGEPPDWEWDEFYLNGVKWKGKTLPKLPILQPEKVTALPLDIRLTEDYDYTLHGEATVSGRRAYHIVFVPRTTVGEKPIYRGSVWIDKETFALLRRDSVQLNLTGETLSNVQSEFYRPVPGQSGVLLPLEIKGQQVFSTAGRTTAIERDVVMQSVRVNPPDLPERRAAAYASQAQMIRDTEKGMRYLVPDAARPGERVVEEKISKKSTFGLLGAFYDDSLDYPLPLLGIQHFNFDLWGKGKQISVFFAGALLTANYTDPSLAGSRLDLGADLFAAAFPFGDVSYRGGKEVPDEKLKHLPAIFQVNVGHPLGPYVKASLGIFTKWDNFQRDKDTGPVFIVPVDTFTDGAELKLVGNISGFNAIASGSYFRRRRWEFWGDPSTSEFDAKQKQYWKYSLSVSKDRYFSGFRKLHLGLSYQSGANLDRFSKYEFGAFSGNPVRGYKTGSLRTESAFVGNISYGLNIEDIIRFEGFYDQALLKDKRSGFGNAYFSGAGLLASLNGPWQNSLVRGEISTPIVSHGVHGIVVNVLLLKLF